MSLSKHPTAQVIDEIHVVAKELERLVNHIQDCEPSAATTLSVAADICLDASGILLKSQDMELEKFRGLMISV